MQRINTEILIHSNDQHKAIQHPIHKSWYINSYKRPTQGHITSKAKWSITLDVCVSCHLNGITLDRSCWNLPPLQWTHQNPHPWAGAAVWLVLGSLEPSEIMMPSSTGSNPVQKLMSWYIIEVLINRMWHIKYPIIAFFPDIPIDDSHHKIWASLDHLQSPS